jgi:hypothetical protein
MNNMKTIRLLMLTTAFLLVCTGIVAARAVRLWPYQELLEKSDLVVLATPTGTSDTKEHIDLPGGLSITSASPYFPRRNVSENGLARNKIVNRE